MLKCLKYSIFWFIGCSLMLVLNSCNKKVPSRIIKDKIVSIDPIPPRNFQDSLGYLVEQAFDESQNFTGIIFYEPNKRDTLISYHSTKNFTPASNTKIFSLLTGLETLGPTLSALSYFTKGDTLFFQGTGYPFFMNNDVIDQNRALDILKSHEGPICFVPDNFQDDHYGSGWSWDDYSYLYQKEKSAMPIYNQTVWVAKQTGQERVHVDPDVLRIFVEINRGTTAYSIRRHPNSNHIELNIPSNYPKLINRIFPFVTDDLLFTQMLSDTLKKEVTLYNTPANPVWKIMKDFETDSLYQMVMKDSDNFLAEQLMLMSSFEVFDTMNTKKIIQHSTENFMSGLPHKMRWVDGSGLSRYNLTTPENLTYTLQKIKGKIGLKGIKNIFPQGGKRSLSSIPHYVFAKSGSLSNNYNLSGFMETKDGSILIFSFMNNHFLESSRIIKKRLSNILDFIHDHYRVMD